MRKILIVLALVFCFNGYAFAEVEDPQGMPNNFQLMRPMKMPCGTVNAFLGGSENDKWGKFVLDQAEKPFLIVHMAESAGGKEIYEAWIDHNQDGKFEEKFLDPYEIIAKYGNDLCSMLK